MPRNYTQIFALLLCAPALVAQQNPQPSTSGKSESIPPGQEMLAGCLQRSGVEYFLSGSDGYVHHLTGGKNMKQYLGHEVELYGTKSMRTIDNTPPGGASSAIEQPVFRIKTLKDLGAPCRSSLRRRD